MKRFIKPAYALLVTAILLLISLNSKSGILYIFELKKEIANLRTETEKINSKNEEIRHTIRELDENKKLIEFMARSRLGLVAPDEIVYEIKDQNPTH